MPEGPANLGYFVSKDQTRKNADNVCVLVVHYNFENAKNKNLHRKGDAQDVKNLERTFRVNRNCNFRSILSPEKGQLLQLLADKEELLTLFGSSEVPSVFVLYILSHGDRDGIIFTDHYQNEHSDEFIFFTTTEIFNSLKMLTGFEECLKFINFGPCRGELSDEIFIANNKNVPFKNENSCRITYSPQMRNMVVFFSTVETTRAKRNQSGTTFAFLTCQVLNSLEKDENLINVLANIQYESHKNVDIMENKYTGQTPEVKMFSQDRSFLISKSHSVNSTSSTFDAMSIKNKKKREFYSWKSSSGENLRHRLAILFSSEPNEQLKEMKRALSQNLDFETSERLLSGKPWASFNEASRIDSDIGCIFLFLFGQVSENLETNEVCVQVDSRETAVSEILREFIGPKNDQWIGKPKILFLVNQETSSFDYFGSTQPKMEISATNHSGWFVFVLHGKDSLQKLIEIFKGQELKQEKSLQELLASLLISDSIESRDLINSTLQYLLNFPDWPRSFVKLNFSVKNSQESQETKLRFDNLLKQSIRINQIWLLSSDAGTGKTTILREMAFQLGRLHPESKILRVSLPRVSFSSLKRNMTEIEFLAKATHNSHDEIARSIENKQCVVFLDGFDEIRPGNQVKLLKVIEALEKKQLSVWIGTRPHAAEAIQMRIKKAVLVKIEPLDQEQQIELLQLGTGKSKVDCEEFIMKFKSKDILKNPLHLSLVAQYRAEGNLYQIYDQVVRHKIEDTLIRKGYDINNFVMFQEKLDIALERLQQIASFHIKGVELIGVSRDELEKINCYGIATFENSKVIFIHQTFAEFLAAQHFLREIEDSGECDVKSCSKLFYGEPLWWCREYVDLFYSTALTDEKKLEEHRASIRPVLKLDPENFLRWIAEDGCVNIFKLVYPIITFSNNLEGNSISVAKDRNLLVSAVDGAEEIAIMLLNSDFIISDSELLIILPSLLESVVIAKATRFFEKLKTKYPRLPEMIHSRRLKIGAGVTAARLNHAEILTLLLQSGVDVDAISKFEGNALYCAIKYGAIKCLEILLQHGAKLAKDVSGNIWDPLVLAARENKLDIVKFLTEENISGLQRNKETSGINEVKKDLRALQNSIHGGHNEIAKYLIEKCPSLKNVANCNEGSLLQISAKNRYFETCQWLVDEAVVDVNTLRTRDISLADENLCMDYFLILQKSDINMADERGKTALHCSAEHGYLERAKELIAHGANIRAVDVNGWNAFHFACKSNSDHKEKVIRLLHSIDSQLAKEKTKSGQTGLHILLVFSNGPSVEEVCLLVEEIGVDVKAKDNKNCTALKFAVSKEWECVDYLMKKDIDLDVKNKRGQTCLHLAAERGDLEALQTWIKLGGDLDEADGEGSTVLHYAAKREHLQFVEKLLAFKDEEERTPDIAEGSVGTSLKKYLRVNRCDNLGRTPLHLAAESKNVELVDMLLKSHADLTLLDLEGKNALHYAINNERMLRFINEKNGFLLKQRLKDGNTTLHLAVKSYIQLIDLEDDNIVRWIVEQGDIDLDAKNECGETPFLLACRDEFWSAAEFLLSRNVEVNVSDRSGKTALQYVKKEGNKFLVELMREKGALKET